MSDMFAMLNSMDETPVVREHFIRAPFGYPGSKFRSLEKILPHLPYRESYCEPFGGTGCVLLSRKESGLEVFNDRFAGVVAFYRCIKDTAKCSAVVEWLEHSIHAREEFIWCRDTWKNCEDDVERAARWYYSILMSFTAQGRHFGRSTKGRAQNGSKLHRNLRLFHPVHSRLQRVQIENQDYRECFKDYDDQDMVWYLDPPYFDYSKSIYEHNFYHSDHLELLERIQHLEGFVALSGYENPLYDKYPWDNKITWTAQLTVTPLAFTDTNNLAGKEDEIKRSTVKEVLWIREAR